MDPKQLLDYSLEGIKWLGLGIGVGYPTLILSPTVLCVLSRKIRNQKELDLAIEEESKKLGLEGVRGIYIPWFDESSTSKSYIADDGIPTIITNNFFGSKSTVRHELYHLYKHAKKKFKSRLSKRLYYFLVGEPQACLYQLTGIKL